MHNVENVILRVFQETPNGKISVKLAHAEIEEIVPTDVSMRRRGQILKKCFGKCLNRSKPRPTKNNPSRQWMYMYYSIELRTPTNDGEKNQGIAGISFTSSWGKSHQNPRTTSSKTWQSTDAPK